MALHFQGLGVPYEAFGRCCGNSRLPSGQLQAGALIHLPSIDILR